MATTSDPGAANGDGEPIDLAAVLIARNEEDNIARCIESVLARIGFYAEQEGD
jgi:hypothetical protein